MPRKPPTPERLLTTVLFTDIVGSTVRASELGDRRWRRLLGEHHAVVRRALRRYGGREVDTAGDGFFATFDQPAQAIRCAEAIVRGVQRLGIEVRAGVHMGEVEVNGSDVSGIAVHIGARVMSKAGPSQVLVSSTVRDLMSGSEMRFDDLGAHELKGVPAQWRLYAVEGTPTIEADEESYPVGEGEPPRRRLPLIVPLTAIVVIVALLVVVVVLATRGGGGGLPAPRANSVGRIDASSNRILGSIAVGRTPIAVAASGDTIWVANFDDGTVQSIDTSSNAASPAVGLGISVAPNAIAVGGGYVWVTGGTTGTLYRIDPTQAHAITSIDLGVGLAGVAFGDDAVWVTNQNDDVVLRLDPRDPAAAPATVQLEPGAAPTGIAVGGGAVWVAESLKGRVARIDPSTSKVVATVPLLKGNPAQVAYGEGFAWVTDTDDDSVTRIDPATGQGTTIPGVGNGPTGIAAWGGAAWVANSLDGTVARIDPKTAKVVQHIQLGNGLTPDGVAIAAEAVWVSLHAP
jgi:class 3 adenylate cyclase/streptogramin lyase